MHSVALLALASAPLSDRRLQLTGVGITLGTLLFSGGCYAFSILEDRKYASISPVCHLLPTLVYVRGAREVLRVRAFRRK